MEDYSNFWEHLSTLPRSKIHQMAEEELMDVRGLSLVKTILHKYNLTNVTINYNLKFAFKKSIEYCPRKEFEKEQGEG